MFSVVCVHLRSSCCAEQGQLKCISVHADTILAVIEHCGTVSLITQSAVSMVANLKPVFFICSGASGRPFYITELHFVDSVLCKYVDREANL